MKSLQNDVMEFASFHIPKGADLSVNVVSSRRRSVEIKIDCGTAMIESERMEIPKVWCEPVITVVPNQSKMSVNESLEFQRLVGCAIFVAQFMSRHDAWQV